MTLTKRDVLVGLALVLTVVAYVVPLPLHLALVVLCVALLVT